ncbi:MAG: type II secretion system protein [Lentisphaeria bacterium]
MSHRAFTMLEVLVVTLLAGMLFAMILPRISVTPKRIVVENALSGMRQAFSETASRSRATGRAIRLTLDPDTSILAVTLLSDSLSREWCPSPSGSKEQSETPAFIAVKENYELSKELEWQLEDKVYDSEGKICFSFFPDGQAGGPILAFTVKKRKFRLILDNITARPNIEELE